MRGGNERDSYSETGCEQMIERTHRRVLACFIGIETEHDFLDIALENARVLRGEGGALWSDDVLHASHETGDQVELPFAHYRLLSFQQRPLRFVQSEKNPA